MGVFEICFGTGIGIEIEESVDFGLDIGRGGIERWWWGLRKVRVVVVEEEIGGFVDIAAAGGEGMGGGVSGEAHAEELLKCSIRLHFFLVEESGDNYFPSLMD